MTAQMCDTVTVLRRRFVTTAVDGTGLFDPGAYGLPPGPWHTACYRGFVCSYRVTRGRLTLDGLELGPVEAPRPGPLGGVAPRFIERHNEWRYRGLGLPVEFTGRLLVGRDHLPETPYLNMGSRRRGATPRCSS